MLSGNDAQEELARVTALLEEAGKNTALRREPIETLFAESTNKIIGLTGIYPAALDGGRIVTGVDFHECMVYWFNLSMPVMKLEIQQTIGRACKEYWTNQKNLLVIWGLHYPLCNSTKEGVRQIRVMTDAEWGHDSEKLMKSFNKMDFRRHHDLAKRCTGPIKWK